MINLGFFLRYFVNWAPVYLNYLLSTATRHDRQSQHAVAELLFHPMTGNFVLRRSISLET